MKNIIDTLYNQILDNQNNSIQPIFMTKLNKEQDNYKELREQFDKWLNNQDETWNDLSKYNVVGFFFDWYTLQQEKYKKELIEKMNELIDAINNDATFCVREPVREGIISLIKKS